MQNFGIVRLVTGPDRSASATISGAFGPPNTSTLQPSSAIHTEYRFLMITEPPRLMSSAAMRVSISRSTS